MDLYYPHLAEDTKTLAHELDTDLVYNPSGCTSIAQPLDVSINRPFKVKLQDSWVAWRRTTNTRTPQGNLRQPTRQEVLMWTSKACNSISENIIIHAFLRCGIANALNGSESDKICHEIPVTAEGEENQADQNDEDPFACVDDFDAFSDDED